MAHKKAGGSSRNGRDTAGRRLGVKKFGGEAVTAGNIIIRQRGTKWHPGTGVGIGTDHTIFALVDGTVTFRTKASSKVFVSVSPAQAAEFDPAEDQFPGKAAHPPRTVSERGARIRLPFRFRCEGG